METGNLKFEEIIKLSSDYIYAAYHYFNEDVYSVIENIDLIKAGDKSAFISTFSPVIESGVIARKDALRYVEEYLSFYVINPEYSVSEVIKIYENERYQIDKDDPRLSVKNSFGDSEYYNLRRLLYLKHKYQDKKDKDVIKIINKAKKQADANRNICLRDGQKVCSNYSFANHIEYKYYLEKYIKENNIQINDKPINEEAEDILDKEIANFDFTVKPKENVFQRIKKYLKK